MQERVNAKRVAVRKEICKMRVFFLTKQRIESTLAQEFALWEWLFVIVHPCCQVRIRVRFDVLVNICRGRKLDGVASIINGAFWLVDSNPVNAHDGWEGEVRQVDVSELPRDSQIENDVLGTR